MCIPILDPHNEKNVIGVLQLLNKNEGHSTFTSLDEDLMTDLTLHIAGSVLNIERDVHSQKKLASLEQQIRSMKRSFDQEKLSLKKAEDDMREKSSKLLNMSKSIAAKEELGPSAPSPSPSFCS